MRFRGKQANEWCLMCGRGWPSGTNGARTMPRHIWARGEGIFLKNLGLKYFYTKREGRDNGQRNIWGLFLLSLQPKIHKSSNSTDPTKLTRHFHVLQNCIFCYCWSMSTTVLLWTSRLIQRHMTHFNQMKIIILWSILILIMPWENHSTWSKTVSESSSEYVLGEMGLWTCHPSFLLCEKSQHQDELMLVNCSAFPRHYRLVSQYILYFASSKNSMEQWQRWFEKKSPNLNLKQYNQFWNIYLWSFLQFLRLYEEKPFSISLAKIACQLEKSTLATLVTNIICDLRPQKFYSTLRDHLKLCATDATHSMFCIWTRLCQVMLGQLHIDMVGLLALQLWVEFLVTCSCQILACALPHCKTTKFMSFINFIPSSLFIEIVMIWPHTHEYVPQRFRHAPSGTLW